VDQSVSPLPVDSAQLVQWLVGLGISAATAAAAFEAEFFRDPSGRPAAEFEEDVLERALATSDGKDGPDGGGGRVGGKRRREEGEAVGYAEGGGLRELAEGKEPSQALRAAAIGATPDVVYVHHDSVATEVFVSSATGAGAVNLPAEASKSTPSSSNTLAVAGGAAPVALEVNSPVDSRAGDNAGALVAADVYPPVVGLLGTHLQTAADVVGASPFVVAAASTSDGMALASAPVALTYPLPPTSTGPMTAEAFLLVDDRETAGSGPSRRAFLNRLRLNPGLANRVVTRRLPIGDAILVARVTAAGAAAFPGAPPFGAEVLLDHLVERKTADDLVASLRDGRLDDQAYWMSASGRRSPTIVVEGNVDAATEGDAVTRAEVKDFLASLSVSTGIFVKTTNDVDETIDYYSSLVRHCCRRMGTATGLAGWVEQNRLKDSAIPGVRGVLTYSLWEKYIKEMRGEIKLQQLWALKLSIVPGIGPVRIDHIMAAGFTTPAALSSAYGRVTSEEEGRMLLARLSPPQRGCRISKTVSAYIYDLFTADMYGSR